MMAEDETYVDGARQIIAQAFPVFTSLQLNLSDTQVKRTEINFLRISFLLTKQETGRSLKFSFAVKTDNSVVVYNSFILKANGQNFAIQDWLLRHPEVESNLTDVSRNPNDFLSCFKTYVDEVLLLARTCLQPYLDTDLWETVPIDLWPYK